MGIGGGPYKHNKHSELAVESWILWFFLSLVFIFFPCWHPLLYHIKVMLMITSAGMVSLVVTETAFLSQHVIATFFTMHKLQENLSTIIEKIIKKYCKILHLTVSWNFPQLLQRVVFLSG